MRVGIDLDGVCFNFKESLGRYLDSIGLNYPVDTTTWNFFEEWGMPLEEYLGHCNDGADAGYIFCGDTFPGVKEAFDRIKDGGNTIHIVTDRSFGSSPSVSHAHTSRWLEQHDLPFDSLTFSRDKTVVNTDLFIEDKLENYDALTEVGVDCYLVDRAWNQRDDARQRITGILEYAEIVEKVQNNGQMRLTFP